MSTEAQQPTGVVVATAAQEQQAPPAPVEAEHASSAESTRVASALPQVITASRATRSPKTGKVPRPMIVAAAVAGVALVALPAALIGLSSGGTADSTPTNTGYAQDSAPDNGFVPNVAERKPEEHAADTAKPDTGTATPGADQGTSNGSGDHGTSGQSAGQQGQQHQQQHQQGPQQPGGRQQGPGPQAPVTHESMAGPGCGGTTRFTGVGSYSDGKNGWNSYGGSACGSSFVSVPMSGDSSKDDPAAYGLWVFNTGPVTTGTCDVSVYVPNGDVTQVGGSPTYYRVFDRFEIAKGTPVGSFQVNQVANRGRWVTVGSFRVNGAKLAVQMLNRGQDFNGPTKTYAHHAAGAIKAKCRA